MTHRSGVGLRGVVLAVGTIAVGALGVSRLEAAETMNRLAQNKLASNRLAQNKLASNKLASNALSATRLEAIAETAEMLSTADGREVYSYIVSCALSEGTTIEAVVPGAPDTGPLDSYTCQSEHCTFQGGLGLAQHWIDRRLDPKGQRWVSACLFARVNLHDTAEAISLRGLAPELTVSQDELELYNAEEGAFFGNLFTDDDGPIDWNACRGRAEAAGGESGGLALRDCTEPDPLDPTHTLCGFNDAGDCADFTPEFPSPYACRSSDPDEGIYGDCHAAPGDGRWPGLHTYREIITVYVAN